MDESLASCFNLLEISSQNSDISDQFNKCCNLITPSDNTILWLKSHQDLSEFLTGESPHDFNVITSTTHRRYSYLANYLDKKELDPKSSEITDKISCEAILLANNWSDLDEIARLIQAYELDLHIIEICINT